MPKTIINCASYTNVDGAESEKEKCMQINYNAVEEIAAWAANNDSIFVNYSTDYVYDGESCFTKETEQEAPLNNYGISKFLGDAATKVVEKHLIFRTSWVYNESGKNFPNTITKLAKSGNPLKIINDQMGAPTYASDLAKASLIAINKACRMDEFPAGIYHLCSKGFTSWYDFARFVVAKLYIDVKVEPTTTESYNAAMMQFHGIKDFANRPLNSMLSMEKFESTFNIEMPHWQDAISRCIENK